MIFKARSLGYLFIILALGGLLVTCLSKREENKDAELIEQRKIPFPAPDSHKADWISYHGTTVDFNVNKARRGGKACFTCHENYDCQACHSSRPPGDHTDIWRTTNHGFSAVGNSERCLTCHRQDYCVRCHNETAPRSHKVSWGQTHCSSCHFYTGLTPGDNCMTCHKQAAHSTAPHPVNGQMQCLLCHT